MILLSDLQKIVSDVGITFVASAVGMLLGFPITVLLGRYMGADDLGLYRMVSTIFGTFTLFVTIGVPNAIIKYVAEFRDNEEKLEQIVSAGLITSVLLGLFSFIFIYLSADLFADFFNMPELSGLLKILAFAFPFSIVNSTLIGLLNGLREMTKNAWVSIVQSATMLVLTFILVFKFGVNGAVSGIVLSSILTTFLLISIKKISSISLNNYFNTTSQIISFGSKTVLANAINLINYQADILMIGYFMTKTDVGVYSVAVMFAKLIWILPDSIQRITFPLISEYHAKKMNEQIMIVVDRCMKYSCLFLIFCTTFFIFFGKEFLALIFGAEFKISYSPLIILLIGTLFYGMTKSVGSIFASIGKVNLVYKIPLVSAIFNILLNMLLIPTYGIIGGAFATSFSLIVSMTLMLRFMRSLLGVKFDFWWYVKVFGITGFLIFVYLMVNKFSISLGLFLITLQCIVYFRSFIPFDDKQKLYQTIHNIERKYQFSLFGKILNKF
nr:flippase [Methanosarcina mazei]